jgi:hypothetical protein
LMEVGTAGRGRRPGAVHPPTIGKPGVRETGSCIATGAEWTTYTTPGAMLRVLRGRTSDRRLRLFACACCRRVWPLLLDFRSRQAIETAESYADGLASEDARETAHSRARIARDALRGRQHDASAGEASALYAAAGAAAMVVAGTTYFPHLASGDAFDVFEVVSANVAFAICFPIGRQGSGLADTRCCPVSAIHL